MLGLVALVYFNIDSISLYIKDFIETKDRVIVKPANEYKRNFDFVSFSNTDDFNPTNKFDIINIYYNILNNGYDTFTFYCSSLYDSCVDDILEIGNNKELLSKINNYVHPFNSFSEIKTKIKGNSVTIKIYKKYDGDKINTINNKLVDIVNSLNLDSLDNRKKIEKIHDYIIDNTIYDENQVLKTSIYDSTSAYGSLIEGYSVCSGYSDAMAIFLDYLGIPNIKVSSENHIWNLVNIDNQWLHLDLTWDDTGNVKYNNNYFLITKERLFSLDTKEHNYDDNFFLEAA